MIKASQIGGARVGVFGYGEAFQTGQAVSAPMFTLKVLGYDYQMTKKIARALGERLGQFPRIRDIDTNSSDWWTHDYDSEITLILNRELLAQNRLYSSVVLDQIQNYIRESISRRRLRIDGRPADRRAGL